MATKREAAKIAALETKVEERHLENLRRFDDIEAKVGAVDGKVADVAKDVKSLLGSRQYGLGFWQAVVLVFGVAGTVAGFVVSVMALWK